MTYKALSLWQPWATLLASGIKRIETRSWMTTYSGPLLIHAATAMRDDCARLVEVNPYFREAFADYKWRHWHEVYGDLPFGAIIGIADLHICIGTASSALAPLLDDRERAFGDFSPGRYAWIFRNARQITPVPFRGRQGLFKVPANIIQEVL